MRRVLGAGILVMLLGSGHVAEWMGGRPGAAPHHPPEGAPALPAPPRASSGTATPAAPPSAHPARYQHEALRFISTAPADSLELLPGIGPVLAARIVADRAARGPFTTWTELDRVRGIGPATIARLESAARRR